MHHSIFCARSALWHERGRLIQNVLPFLPHSVSLHLIYAYPVIGTSKKNISNWRGFDTARMMFRASSSSHMMMTITFSVLIT